MVWSVTHRARCSLSNRRGDPAMNASSTTQDRRVAYILVKCQMGLEQKVATSLYKINGGAEVDIVYGTPYDVIVKVVCDTLHRLDTTK